MRIRVKAVPTCACQFDLLQVDLHQINKMLDISLHNVGRAPLKILIIRYRHSGSYSNVH